MSGRKVSNPSIREVGSIGSSSTVYKDINVGGAILLKAAANQPGLDEFVDSTGTDTGITTYAFEPTELVNGSFELQHDYKEGSDIYFHLHWQGITAPGDGSDNVKWQLIYTLSRDGSVLSAATPITTEDVIDTQYGFVLSTFDAIDGSAFKIGDQFLFQLQRIAASSDEYAGDALLATAGIHYEIDTLGSRAITTK